MKKNILLSILGIFMVSMLLIILMNNHSNEYIMSDGTMLALTIDGVSATSFPNDTNKYHVDINCKNNNGVGQYLPLKEDNYNMKFTIKDITADGARCYLDFTTITNDNMNEYLLKTKVESDNPTNNNGYRYSGKQPDNWVWFNNELWRIIGSIPTTLSDGETLENRVKIIRAESIGNLAHHEDTSPGKWGDVTLSTLLNTKYYGKVDATGDALCIGNSDKQALCNYTNIGISNDSNDYYGRMVIDVYMNSGNVGSKKIDAAFESEAATLTSTPLKIGIMNVTDYGYAISGIDYSTTAFNTLGSYVANNWLFGKGVEWTMSKRTTYNPMRINYAGGVGHYYSPSGYTVRPVVYLDPSVYIISGEGTESNPYILGM